ncbi:MAG: flagellar basal-body rod protein FlgF [Pseudolabrys sp.]|nr:flagellar basal-body rod protein FlgF [Pseudolabrys sp.]MBV9261344.1 flagellar basal-body rod protein FlgF [Pseudolabrys sp.]
MQNAALVGLSRQVALQRELDVVANNIANMNTIGFKADSSVFEEFLSPTARGDGVSTTDARVSFVRDRGTWHDLSQGSVETTGNPLDISIDGKAFLTIQTPRGERYTRNGALQINAQGQLVTTDGSPVLGESGPISLQPGDHDVSVSPEGVVSVREGTSIIDSQRGKLRLVSFDAASEAKLQKDGSGAFNANGGTPTPDKTSRVIQGSIEKSNVRGVVEMTRMMEITRAYTQVAAMLQQQSDMRTSAINKLADVPA